MSYFDESYTDGSGTIMQHLGRYGPVIGLIGIFVVFSILAENFLTVDNQINLLVQSSIIGILAIGVTFPILCAEIDLSIASVLKLTGVTVAALATGSRVFAGFNVPGLVALILGLLLGVSLGGIFGYATAHFDIPSFMTTLAILFLADGLGLIVSGGRPISGLPDIVLMFGGGQIAGIPIILIVFLSLLIVSQLVLSYTRFGLYIYAVGSNRNATELMGINVQKIRIGVLMISGLFASIAGIVMIGRISSANSQMGANLLLPPIAAVILGGANLFGGSGNMGGTLVGVLILGVLSNGLNLMGVDPAGQLVAQGIVLMLALLSNALTRD